MDADAFRRTALEMPDATESAHGRHPDFRVRNKVFATLGYPDAAWGMVKLTPEQQEVVVGAHPEVFRPSTGAWGRGGSTLVRLEALDPATAVSVLRMAWENVTATRRAARPASSARPRTGRP
ncbi:MAG: hypothetical protein BGO51_07965 [Rhodospirillales bacterium 69-11]|nr:MmcQ/YjbR family DNA-binding protein [Rhodospirillales bacterium]OJW24312.1 MAG: hypothetical protein BGO51_07965 [Rhodospirillales bacterium 69-11]